MTSQARAIPRQQSAAAACRNQVHADFAEAFPATPVPPEPILPAVQEAETAPAAANQPNQPPHCMIVQGDDLPFPLVMAAPPAIATVAPTAAPAIAPAEEQPQRAPRRELSLAEKYHNPLCNFMSFRDGIACDCNHEFTREQHEPLTALDFYRWCKHHVYGNADADEGVSPPLHYRVNSVLAWK